MLFGNGATTAATTRAIQSALDREDELVRLCEVGLEHADIGNIERDRDKRLLGHGASSVSTTTTGGDCAPILPRSQPLDIGTFTGSPREPRIIVVTEHGISEQGAHH